MQLINITFWILLIAGALGLFLPNVFGGAAFVNSYSILLQAYLFGFTAFQVMKRVFFYRIKGDINIVKLVKDSDWQQRLLLQGVVLALLFLAYVHSYGKIMSFDTIMIGILLFYYCTQVLEHGRPSLYLDDHSFSYDDYVVKQWPWSDLSQIDLKEEQLTLIGANSDFQLNYESIDDIDFVRLSDELERSILDGEFASNRTSNSLKDIILNYASANGIKVRSLDEKQNNN